MSSEDLNITSKLHSGDLLTTADLRSEEIIKYRIGVNFPDDIIVAEETEEDHDLVQDPKFTSWVCDPIDGTNNFSKGFEYYGISIGLENLFLEESLPLNQAIFI